MTLSCDVGSLPFDGDFQKFTAGASLAGSLSSLLQGADHPDRELVRYFEEKVIQTFSDKVRAGIDIANYPQFRDMNSMILDLVAGLKKTQSGYVESGVMGCEPEEARIPEVDVIRRSSRRLFEEAGRPIPVKICVTGPYTLSSLFTHRDGETFRRLGEVVSTFVANSIFRDKYCSVDCVTIDEPTFGLLSDPLIDYGSEGREHLLAAWEKVFHQAGSRGVRSLIHLHDTSDELFWSVKSLNIIESHVKDPVYQSQRTKDLLEHNDKFLKASICITNFEDLVEQKVLSDMKETAGASTIHQQIGDVWEDIKQGKRNPMEFLEDGSIMTQRLVSILDRYGVERVPYAGPECGLRSFPTYESAIGYCNRLSNAIKALKTWT